MYPTWTPPPQQTIKDLYDIYFQLDYLRKQLKAVVVTGIDYVNRGDKERAGCLTQVNDWLEQLENKAPEDFSPHLAANQADPGFNKLIAHGNQLARAANRALRNWDGTIIEIWNTAAKNWGNRGVEKVQLQESGFGAGLASYSAEDPPMKPGKPLVNDEARSKFKVWTVPHHPDVFVLQALGIADSAEPVFLQLSDRIKLSGWVGDFMVGFAASATMGQITSSDGAFQAKFCFKREDLEQLQSVLGYDLDDTENFSKPSKYACVEPQDHNWEGNQPYLFAAMKAGEGPRDWLKDGNAQFEIRTIDDEQKWNG